MNFPDHRCNASLTPGSRGLHHRGWAFHACCSGRRHMVFARSAVFSRSPKPCGVRPINTRSACFVNKMDRSGANFFKVVRTDQNSSEGKPVPS